MYFSGFYFNVRSAFKGRFRSILATIRDQFCLNMIRIESKMQEDHEELKIIAPKLLNFFTIQSKVKFTEREHPFYRKFHCKKRGPSNSLNRVWMAMIAQK